MDDFIPPKDCNNKPVAVGDKVRVLSISNGLLDKLPDDEVKSLRSMIGDIFIVEEIDEYGGVWVEKVWDTGNGTSQSHRPLGSDQPNLLKFSCITTKLSLK